MWSPCQQSHTWAVIPMWGARRKCSTCGAIAYLGLALEGPWKKPTGIYEYKCPKCKGPTTWYKHGKAQPCPHCSGTKTPFLNV